MKSCSRHEKQSAVEGSDECQELQNQSRIMSKVLEISEMCEGIPKLDTKKKRWGLLQEH